MRSRSQRNGIRRRGHYSIPKLQRLYAVYGEWENNRNPVVVGIVSIKSESTR
jgi:hypothetical protein